MRLAAAIAVLLLALSLANAEDNTTTNINGTTKDYGGASLRVGDTGTNNVWNVYNGGLLTNYSQILVGNTSTAKNNKLTCYGSGSRIMDNYGIYVGQQGSFNSAVFSNSATISCNTFVLANNNSGTARSNTVIITDAGTFVNCLGEWTVGKYGGEANTMLLSNGAAIYCSSIGRLGGSYSAYYGSSNNVAIITGTGTTWTNADGFYIGYSTTGNRLIVENGGLLWSTNAAYVGFRTNGNELVLQGASPTATFGSLMVSNNGALNFTNGSGQSVNGPVTIAPDSFLNCSAASATINGMVALKGRANISGRLTIRP